MSSVKRPDIFVSATTGDLSHIRELAKQALLSIDCHPVEQSNFPPDYREVSDMLRAKIEACDAVLHIVGIRYGAEPAPATLPEGSPRRSYTQMEADLARELGKKLYLFHCLEDFPFRDFPPESEEKATLQQAYRAELTADKQLYTSLANEGEVALRVRELQPQVESLKQSVHSLEDTLKEGKKSHKKLFLLSTLGLLLLGGLGWWGYDSTRKETKKNSETIAHLTLDQSRIDAIRLNGTKRIEQDYQTELDRIKNDPTLANDWKQRKELSDQASSRKNSLLASLERFIESAQASYQNGEILPELEEFLHIFASKEGLSGALAYYESIRDEHAAEGAKLDTAEAEVTARRRAHYRLDLEAANATVTAGDWDQAGTLYLELIKKINNWGDPRLAYAIFLLYTKGPDQEKYSPSEEALATYQKALRQTEFLTLLEPESTEYLRENSTVHNKLGDLQLRLGNTDKALDFFQQAFEIEQKLVKLDPNNSLFQRGLSFSFNKLGTLQLRLGNTDKALDFSQQALAVTQKLVKLDPNNSQFQRDLSLSYDNLGTLQLRLGNTDKALAFFKQALEIKKNLGKLDPNNSQFQRSLSVSFDNFGALQLRLGNTDKALDFFQQSSDGFQKLVTLDPNNSQFQRDLSISFDNLGDLQFRLGNTDKALDFFQQALVARQKFVTLAPNNAQFQRDLFVSYYKLSTAYQSGEKADIKTALDFLRKSHSLLLGMKNKAILAPDDERFIEQLAKEIQALENNE